MAHSETCHGLHSGVASSGRFVLVLALTVAALLGWQPSCCADGAPFQPSSMVRLDESRHVTPSRCSG